MQVEHWPSNFNVHKNHLGSLMYWRFRVPSSKIPIGKFGHEIPESEFSLSSWGDSDVNSFRPALKKSWSSHWVSAKMLVYKLWICVSKDSQGSLRINLKIFLIILPYSLVSIKWHDAYKGLHIVNICWEQLFLTSLL